jgi:hypothetical protein
MKKTKNCSIPSTLALNNFRAHTSSADEGLLGLVIYT